MSVEEGLSKDGIQLFHVDGICVSYECTNVATSFNIFPADSETSSVNALDLPAVAITCRGMGADYNRRRFAPCSFRLSHNTRLNKFLREESIYSDAYNNEEVIKVLKENVVVFLFSYGKAVLIGAKNYNRACTMAQQFSTNFSRYMDIPAGVYNFVLTNMVFSFELPFSLNLASLLEFPELSQRISYNPTNFPMACIRPDKIQMNQSETLTADSGGKNITIMVSVGGSGVMIGSRTTAQALEALSDVMTYFRKVEVAKGQIASSDMAMEVVRNQHVRLLDSYDNQMWNVAAQLVGTGGGGPQNAIGADKTAALMNTPMSTMAGVGDDQNLDMIAVVEAMREGLRKMKSRGELGDGSGDSRAGTKRKRLTAGRGRAKKTKR